jgi:predicted ATPase
MIDMLSELGYQTTVEHARMYMDQQMKKGLTIDEIRQDPKKLQTSILDLQINREKDLEPEQEVFLDRAIPDAKAYYQFLGLDYDNTLTDAIDKYKYKKIFVLDILPMENDDVRTENHDEQLQIHECLIEVYEKLGYQIVEVPVLSPKERVQFILEHKN